MNAGLFDPSGYQSNTALSMPLPAASQAPDTSGYVNSAPAAAQAPPPPSGAVLNAVAGGAPDPYTVMMQRMTMLRQQRLDALGGW